MPYPPPRGTQNVSFTGMPSGSPCAGGSPCTLVVHVLVVDHAAQHVMGVDELGDLVGIGGAGHGMKGDAENVEVVGKLGAEGKPPAENSHMNLEHNGCELEPKWLEPKWLRTPFL